MSLLGFMAAGAAMANRDAVNKDTENENAIRSMVFEAEVKDAYQQRVEQRLAANEGRIYSRNRTDTLADETRKLGEAREDTETQFRMQKELQKEKDAAAAERMRIRESGANARHSSRLALLKAGGKGATETGGSQIREQYESLIEKRRKLAKEEASLDMRQKNSEYAKVLRSDLRRVDIEARALENAMTKQAEETGATFNTRALDTKN